LLIELSQFLPAASAACDSSSYATAFANTAL
jgi:hypothetical protein